MNRRIGASMGMIMLSLTVMPWPGMTVGTVAAEGKEQLRQEREQSHDVNMTLPNGVVGVSLQVSAERIGDPALLYVAHVHPEGPARQAGVSHGDEITFVDGTAVVGKTYEQVVKMVRGEPGSSVKLNVKNDSSARELAVTRVASETLYKHKREPHEGGLK